MAAVIGCDVGTQGSRAVLLSEEGQVLAEASASYPVSYPRATWAEQDPNDWINGLKKVIPRVVQLAGIAKGEIKALSLASQVDGVVAVDAAGQALHPALIWMDRRATRQCKTVGDKTGREKIFQISGLNLDPSHVAPKIRWLADDRPDVYQRAAGFLLPGSFVAQYLSGERAVDYSNGSSTLLMDVRQKRWSQELCALFEIDTSQLPPLYPSITEIGRIRPSMAQEMDLDALTRVILGSGDEHAACLGAGIVQPGLVGDIAGSAEPVCAAIRQILFDSSGLIETHCHADPELWLLENPGFISGANYRWFKDQFALQEINQALKLDCSPYQLLDEMADKIPPGSEGLLLLPCLMGAMTPTWNSAARGTFFGFTLAHTRAHFTRAVLEASAYGVRDITDQMQRIGMELKEIRVIGGGANSRLWRQIKADVTGIPVSLPQIIETTALGAGLLALTGLGYFSSLKEATNKVVNTVEILEPQIENHARYEGYYQLYRNTYQALLPVFDQAAKIG